MIVDRLRDGAWITPARLRMAALLLLGATLLGYGALLLTAHGTLDWQGRPIGTDFSDVYAAGWMANRGDAAAAWVWPAHYAAQQAIHHSRTVPFYGWHYPPPFLLVAALLAHLPYLPALLVWQGVTMAGALVVLQRILPGRETLLLAAAAPAAFVCLGHGQNGFLTAALLGGGMWLLARRPFAAGLLLGCLVYKPQFAVLLPVILIAAWRPRAIAGAALSSLGLIAATLLLWGWPVWHAFLGSLPLTRSVVIEQGNTGWEKIVTAFAAARALGAPVGLAYAFQAASTAAAVAGAAAAARWANPRLAGAAAAAAALLSTPYALDYDLVLLGPALAFLIADARERGWLDWEKSALALAYAAPLIGRQLAAATAIPLDLIASALVFALALRRAWRLDRAAASDHRHAAVDVERLAGDVTGLAAG